MNKMRTWKKAAAGILTAGLVLGGALCAVASESEGPSELVSDGEVIRVGAMSGPTAMGLVKLMDEAEQGETANSYEFADLLTDASAFVAPLTEGSIDIAAVPSNLASVLYNNTQGGVEVLAINVMSVLNVVERGDTVSTVADLAGKTIYATGEGATPEAVLDYVLSANGLDPDSDLTIQWCADTTEALSYISENEEAIAMLPQPFVTAACAKVEDLHVAFALSDEWAKIDPDSQIVTGVLVARTEFIEEHPEEIEAFLEEYAASAAYTAQDVEGAAALVVKYGILQAEPVAQKAIPNCAITCVTGEEMKETLSAYLDVLLETNPKLVGGAAPADDFYYGCE